MSKMTPFLLSSYPRSLQKPSSASLERMHKVTNENKVTQPVPMLDGLFDLHDYSQHANGGLDYMHNVCLSGEKAGRHSLKGHFPAFQLGNCPCQVKIPAAESVQ